MGAVEHTLIGGMAGVVEVSIQQPTVTIKNALQEGRPIPWTSLRSMYRGWSIGAASMTPVNAVQFGSYKLIENFILGGGAPAPSAAADAEPELTGHTRLLASTAAGMLSAFVSTPAETIVVQQQRNGSSLFGEINRMVTTMSPLNMYRGLTAVMIRDGAFCLGFLGLTPTLEREILAMSDGAAGPRILPYQATVLAGLCSGFVAGSSTHMFDTVKTRMQANVGPDARAYPDLLTTFRKVYAEGGLALLMRGWVPRTARAMGAVVILSMTRNTMTEKVENWRAEGLML